MRLFWILIACCLTASCSPAQLLNDVAPDSGLTTLRDISYGSDPRQRVDVYQPVGAERAPVVVFFYGGSWQSGSKADYAFVARTLARRGIVTMVPDYRLYPQAKFAGFMQDGASAVAWTMTHAAQYGGDPGRVVLMGHSAGAHIAALLTLNPRWLGAKDIDPRRELAGAVGLAGPYDFLPLKDPVLKVIFGPPARLADTQPINFVDGHNPPMFLATDEGDTTVEPRNTEALVRRIRDAGGPVETKTYSGLSHTTLIGVVSDPLGFASPVRDDVVRFILALPRAAGR